MYSPTAYLDPPNNASHLRVYCKECNQRYFVNWSTQLPPPSTSDSKNVEGYRWCPSCFERRKHEFYEQKCRFYCCLCSSDWASLYGYSSIINNWMYFASEWSIDFALNTAKKICDKHHSQSRCFPEQLSYLNRLATHSKSLMPSNTTTQLSTHISNFIKKCHEQDQVAAETKIPENEKSTTTQKDDPPAAISPSPTPHFRKIKKDDN